MTLAPHLLALRDAVNAAPGDRALHLIFADALIEAGEPQGGIHRSAAGRPDGLSEELDLNGSVEPLHVNAGGPRPTLEGLFGSRPETEGEATRRAAVSTT